MAMLVLFDIDGTLLRTHSAGLRAMAAATKRLHGIDNVSFENIQTAGRLDPLIWKDLFDAHGLETSDAHHDSFRATYGEELARIFAEEKPAVAMPGVHEAVAYVHNHPEMTCALLTGNYPETGWMKLREIGFTENDFVFGTWGTEAPTRRGLPPVALQRHGGTLAPEHALIIGDTPADIDCAHASGCRVLAVATGNSDVEELQAHNPDALMADLGDLDAFIRTLDTLRQ
jgi:phosphoglycolate phosphatase